jgi:plasmid maintenance system antidote protein VapI
MEACHENNNRSDNRLENLRWDTPKANQADRIRHGTANVGEQNPMSKLSSDDVAKIKKLWESGTVTQREIAGQLGVTSNHIWHILKGRRWAHAERINDESVIRRAGAAHYKSKFSDDDIVAIRNLARHGVSQREIADRYGVRQSTISAIVSRKTWKHIQEVSNG